MGCIELKRNSVSFAFDIIGSSIDKSDRVCVNDGSEVNICADFNLLSLAGIAALNVGPFQKSRCIFTNLRVSCA